MKRKDSKKRDRERQRKGEKSVKTSEGRNDQRKTEKKKNRSETTGKWGGGGSKEIGKEGEIVPDLDLRGSGPSDVSIS